MTLDRPAAKADSAPSASALKPAAPAPAPLVLLPLDERPVNVQLPADVAAIAGTTLHLPPSVLLPDFRTPGDAAGLGQWLRTTLTELSGETAAPVDALVSLDMLCYGGLIASRTSADDLPSVIGRLEELKTIHERCPGVNVDAVGLVMRASSNSASVEEPDYWHLHGHELHVLGGSIHRYLDESEIPPLSELTRVPAEVVADFERRRLRNHIVNLHSLDLAESGVLRTLAITADDTAEFSAGSAEQTWLRHWMRALPSGRSVHMYPGADEVGATLVARSLTARHGITPRIHIECAHPEALQRVPPYENQPLTASIDRQLGIVGAVRAHDVEGAGKVGAEVPAADAILVVHGPEDGRQDLASAAPLTSDERAAAETGALIQRLLAEGHHVALADVRYPNGADPLLGDWLVEHGLLLELEAYSAWNTAGNTLGSVLSLLVAGVVGRATGTLDECARRVALVRRLLDDFAYQGVIRRRRFEELFRLDSRPLTPERALHAEDVIGADLQTTLQSWGPTGVDLVRTALPWKRAFEVGLELTAQQ